VQGIYKTNEYLIRFLSNLLLDENNILKNRELHIRFVAPENVTNIVTAVTDNDEKFLAKSKNGGVNGGVNNEDGGVNDVNGGVNGGVNNEDGGVNGGVSLLQKQIINFMQQNSQISVAEIAKQSNKPRRTIENNVKKLKEKGIIVRIGSDKTGSWEIIKQGGEDV
jgi:predicted HTH transcriptional regulator